MVGMPHPDQVGIAANAGAFVSASSPKVFPEAMKTAPGGVRRLLQGPFPLVAGTGFEPATSGL